MKEVLIIGDLHIERLQLLFRKWKKWTFEPLYQAEAYAIKNKIPDIIQTGDIFDTPNPMQDSIALLVDFLRKSKVNWHFLLGNHDKSDKKRNSLIILKYLSRKYGLTNCFVYIKPTETVVNGIPTIFLPWPISKSPVLNTRPSLVIAHIERKGARYDNKKIVDDNDFDLGKHYWVLGHLHTFQKISERCLFLGAVYQLKHGDTDKKFMLHLKANLKPKSIDISYKAIPIKPPFILKTIRVSAIYSGWQKEFENLQKKDYVRFLIHSDVAMPQNYLNHPKVLTHDYYGGKKLKDVVIKSKHSKITNNVFDRIKILKPFLANFLTKKKRKKALKKAKYYESQILI